MLLPPRLREGRGKWQSFRLGGSGHHSWSGEWSAWPRPVLLVFGEKNRAGPLVLQVHCPDDRLGPGDSTQGLWLPRAASPLEEVTVAVLGHRPRRPWPLSFLLGHPRFLQPLTMQKCLGESLGTSQGKGCVDLWVRVLLLWLLLLTAECWLGQLRACSLPQQPWGSGCVQHGRFLLRRRVGVSSSPFTRGARVRGLGVGREHTGTRGLPSVINCALRGGGRSIL